MIDRRRFLSQAALSALAVTPWPKSTWSVAEAGAARELPYDDQVARVLTQVFQEDWKMPGLVAAIVRGDRLVGIAAEGVRKVGDPAPIRVTDRFHLGSCTKAMTATLLGSVVDSGQLSWDSTLAAVFPNEANAMHADYRGVTLDQLLGHRGGLPDNTRWWSVPQTIPIEAQRRSLIASALGMPPRARPRIKVPLFQFGLHSGRRDGRSGDGDLVGNLDPAGSLRAPGNDLGGVRPARLGRGGGRALGPCRARPFVRPLTLR